MSIEHLNQGTPAGSSSIPFYDATNGRDARCSISELAALILSGLSSAGFATQYAAPNASGFVITVTPPAQGSSTWLLVTPVADYAALTVILPIGSDGQEVLVSSTHAVSGALTVTGASVGGGAQAVNGAPATLVANGFFRLKFNGVTSSWHRVG